MEEILKDVTEDCYNELCGQADVLGMESLTENEQFIVLNFKKYLEK